MEETQIIEEPIVTTSSTTTQEETKAITTDSTPTNPSSLLKNLVSNRPLSRYCLRLVDREKPQLIALMLGSNRIGRSAQSDYCILDKSVSKSHAIVEVTEDEASKTIRCEIKDQAAVNRIRLITKEADNDKEINTLLDKNESKVIHPDDYVLLGSVKFQLSKVTILSLFQKKNPYFMITIVYMSFERDMFKHAFILIF
jgi:hypothetical protein